jgi:hypothetical protein
MNKIQKVKIKQGTRQMLAEQFDVSLVMVSQALNGKSNSRLANRIREAAVELGGDPIYSEINKTDKGE